MSDDVPPELATLWRLMKVGSGARNPLPERVAEDKNKGTSVILPLPLRP
jgi:hypothetical protein